LNVTGEIVTDGEEEGELVVKGSLYGLPILPKLGVLAASIYPAVPIRKYLSESGAVRD